MKNQWIKRHISDPYVKKAQQEGYLSRAAYKLLEIQNKYQLIKPGMHIVDLGAAPGGWSQVAKKQVGFSGQVFSVDLLPISETVGTTFLQGDFRETDTLEQLLSLLAGKSINGILSDMAPNFSGNKSVDQPRSLYLAELALEFATKVLEKDGFLLMKCFQGQGTETFIQELKKHFVSLRFKKPQASRAQSREIYLLAEGYKADPGTICF